MIFSGVFVGAFASSGGGLSGILSLVARCCNKDGSNLGIDSLAREMAERQRKFLVVLSAVV